MKCRNFVKSLLADLIPPKFEVGQNFYSVVHVQIVISLSIFDGFQQMRAQNLSQIMFKILSNG